MKITIIGSGYVGLVSGACFAELGHNMTCVDIDEQKINNLKKGKVPIYEPGLDALILKNLDKNIFFTTNLGQAMNDSSVVMIAVGTPTNENDKNGAADLRFVYQVTRDIAKYLKPYQVVVTKSTVPVGTARNIIKIIHEERADLKIGEDFDVASNPEFLREGSAISDFMNPDRVVLGIDSDKAKDILNDLYKPLKEKGFSVFSTKIESSELIKYAANGFLAMKIAFINQISDLCEAVDADIDDVSYGIGLDKRINPHFLKPGPGYGGSCFPKDTKALTQTAISHGSSIDIIDTVIKVNEDRKQRLANRLIAYFKAHPEQKRLAILGVTFKANTDDLRDASSLVIIPELLKAGIEVIVYDPLYYLGSEHENKIAEFKGVTWAKDLHDAITGAHGLCILTEWDDFKDLNLKDIHNRLVGKKPLFADYRNLYHPKDLYAFYSLSLGRKDQNI